MKKTEFIVQCIVGVLFGIGFALGTGIDQNARQIVPAVAFIAMAAGVYYLWTRYGKKAMGRTARMHKDYAQAA